MTSSTTEPVSIAADPPLTGNNGVTEASGHQAITAAPDDPSELVTSNNRPDQTSQPKGILPFDADLFYSEPPELQDAQDQTDDVLSSHSQTEQPPHPPNFKPFFTLIEDPETGVYHHPTVHYIFSDDDPEILTSAVLDAIDEDEPSSDQVDRTNVSSERSIIVQVAADGHTISSASSLSPDWHATKAVVGPAPSWDGEAAAADRGLMLKIAGQRGMSKSITNGNKLGPGSIEEMLEAFHERIAGLDEALGKL